MKDERISRLLAIVKNPAAPRGEREKATAELKTIKADRERKAERQRLCDYLEHAREIGDAVRIAFAESRLQEIDTATAEPVTAPVTQPDISGWVAAHERYHGREPEPSASQGTQVDLSDPTQAFWEREGRQQADRALAAKRVKPANPPVIVWGSDSEF